ncbi:MAG: hypothetical protein F6K47_04195 [Symploca sp. SIO2E6]|nr:hypothetical protein [Symploca sp. SIO2E6]
MVKQTPITTTDVVAITSLAVATGTAAYLIASAVKPEPLPEPTSTPVKTILTTNQ